jgi:glycosyltransferase involved in cell wall biosynthesis
MSSSETDIILPVWNRPGETRECLSALVEHSEDARLILLDLGSDPETEQLLHEFAEFLGDRAILFRSERTRGFVETVNRGLSTASAPLMIALRASSRVTSGWLEPLRAASQAPDSGVLVPRLVPHGVRQSGKKRDGGRYGEASHGTFSAIGITRRLYERIGGFDCGLDGDVVCLRDYSRRADRAGFRTVHVEGPPVLFREEAVYGSPARRDRLLRESRAEFIARWGDERTYCVHLSREADKEMLERVFGMILTGARRGNRIIVLAPSGLYRSVVGIGLHRLHENITVERLSRFFPSRSVRSAFDRFLVIHPDMKLLNGMEGLRDLDGEVGVPVAEMVNSFTAVEV